MALNIIRMWSSAMFCFSNRNKHLDSKVLVCFSFCVYTINLKIRIRYCSRTLLWWCMVDEIDRFCLWANNQWKCLLKHKQWTTFPDLNQVLYSGFDFWYFIRNTVIKCILNLSHSWKLWKESTQSLLRILDVINGKHHICV